MASAWISLEWQKDAVPINTSFMAFRKQYFLEDKPVRGILYIAATPRYRLWINGKFVVDGNVRSFAEHKMVDRVDVTSYLKKGKNTLAFVVSSQNGSTSYGVMERTGLYVRGIINQGKEKLKIQTDQSWQVRAADWYIITPFYYTLPIGKSEHYDETREFLNWKIYEDNEDNWGQAYVLGEAGTPPWKHLQKNDLPKFQYQEMKLDICWVGKSSMRKYSIKEENLSIHFNKAKYHKKNFENEKSTYLELNHMQNVYTFDAKKTVYAYPQISVKDIEGNIRLELYYDNRFEETPSCFSGFDNPLECACDTYTPTKSSLPWISFMPRGFHFITIKLTGKGKCKLHFSVLKQEYPYGSGKLLNSTNILNNQIWEISKETLRSGTTDVIGEPFRENVLWTFDACVGGQAAYDTFSESKMWKHCLRLIGQGIDMDGIPKTVVPSQYSFMILFDQMFYWVVSCWDYYRRIKDIILLQEVAPAIKRFLKLCIKNITNDGYFIPPSYAWHWIDWALVNKAPYALPINAMLLWALQSYINIGSALNMNIDFEKDQEKQLRSHLEKFYDNDIQAFKSRIPCDIVRNNNSIYQNTETELDIYGNTLAYWTKVGTLEQRKLAVKKIADLLLESEPTAIGNNPVMGIGWVQILLQPLLEEGYKDEISFLLEKYYKPYVLNDAKTWGEDFVPNPFNTAHAWGAGINILLAQIQEEDLDEKLG